MALYDMFEEYRDPNLSEDEQLDVAEARELDGMMRNDPSLAHEPGGVRNRGDGVFVPYPLVQAHIGIAMNRAQAQFQDFDRQQLVMPEDPDVGIRFPGVDPVGKYSVIDMKFAQRETNLRAALESRSPEVRAYVNDMLNKCGDRQSAFYDVRQQMLQSSIRHRQITRASKLCLDADGRRLLHQQSRVLETELQVEQYDKLMQGLEYAAGVRQGPVPREITDFYRDRLNTGLDLGMVSAARNLNQVPPRINVEFQDLDHKMLQQTFANPHNWGKSPDEVAKAADGIDIEAYSGAIPAYAVATANRVIDPLFREMEKDAPANAQGLDIEFSRGDLIAIDGVTVRETMQQRFDKLAMENRVTGSFADFYKQNVKRAASELVAAGLMAGKRVEAFVPDKYGQIPKEPTQITKTGYEPSPAKPEKFNAWQRFFAKRGFYKAKVARQAEYERVMAARERMKKIAQASEQALGQDRKEMLTDAVERHKSLAPIRHKELFFGEIMGELGLRTFTTTPEGKTEVAYDWSGMNSHMQRTYPEASGAFKGFTRVEAAAACIMGLMAEGKKFEDIMNPAKLQPERQAMARQFMERAKTNDQEWLGRIYYGGFKAVMQDLREMTQGVDPTNEAEMVKIIPKAEAMSRTAFGASQTLASAGCRLGFHKAAIEEANGDITIGSQRAEALNDKISDVSTFSELSMASFQGQAKLIDPKQDIGTSIVGAGNALNACISGVIAAQFRKQGPSIIEWSPKTSDLMDARRAAISSEGVKNAASALNGSTPEQRASVVRDTLNGRLVGEQLRPSFKVNEIDSTDLVFRVIKGEDGILSLKEENVKRTLKMSEATVKLGKSLKNLTKEMSQTRQRQAPQAGGPKR